MASTVHLEYPFASGSVLTIELAGDGPPAPGEMALLARLAEMVERSTLRARDE